MRSRSPMGWLEGARGGGRGSRNEFLVDGASGRLVPAAVVTLIGGGSGRRRKVEGWCTEDPAIPFSFLGAVKSDENGRAKLSPASSSVGATHSFSFYLS